MAKPKLDRKTLLRNSLSVFKSKGYNGTSMNDLAAANGLLKGSFYHYIDSKESLMLEVLSALKEYYVNKVFSKVYDETLSLSNKVEEITSRAQEIYTHEEGGDFFVNIGLETLNTNPKFGTVIRSFFNEWVLALTHLFSHVYNEEESRTIAEVTVAEIEGAVILMRLLNDPNYLTRTLNKMKNIFKNQINNLDSEKDGVK